MFSMGSQLHMQKIIANFNFYTKKFLIIYTLTSSQCDGTQENIRQTEQCQDITIICRDEIEIYFLLSNIRN